MRWYSKYATIYDKPFSDVPQDIIATIQNNIQSLISSNPLVTVAIIGYNEEKNLAACLWSLSDMICKYPVEIIGIDNDSSDNTAKIFKTLNVPVYIEYKHSSGHARNCALAHAKGKYQVNIDADTIYPNRYVETMVDKMISHNAIAAFGLWSYMPDRRHSSIAIFFYELLRDTFLCIQSIKRPELCVRGMVFAHNTQIAKEFGFRGDIKRGEDGSMTLNMKKRGKIIFVKSRKARPVTGYRTLDADGSFFQSFLKRAIKAVHEIKGVFSSKDSYKDSNENLIK